MKVSAITAQVLLNNEADVIFGPLCNDETVTVADLAANLRVPMFASFGTDVDLLNKKRFKTYVRMSYTKGPLQNSTAGRPRAGGYGRVFDRRFCQRDLSEVRMEVLLCTTTLAIIGGC